MVQCCVVVIATTTTPLAHYPLPPSPPPAPIPFAQISASLAFEQQEADGTIPNPLSAAPAASFEESRECPVCLDDSLELVRATCKCGIRFCEPCTVVQVCEYARKGEVPMCLNASECGQKMRRSEVMRLQVYVCV